MTTDLDRAVRSSLADIIATAPEPDGQPVRLVTVGIETPTRRPYLAATASLLVVAGVGALIAIKYNDTTPVAPAATPIATDDSSQPLSTTTTLLGGTEPAPAEAPSTNPSCAISGPRVLVPDVAGMPWEDAVAVLAASGLEPLPLPELPPPASDPDSYVIVRQNTAPGKGTLCGSVVALTIEYRPGPLYVVQDGDTYESIAASQGITLDELLGFQGLSIADLETSGGDISAPLAVGQALRLSQCASSNTPASETCFGPNPDLDTAPASFDPASPNTAAPTTTTTTP